jgi:hypothetical protein
MTMIKHELAQMEMNFFASIHKEMAPGVSFLCICVIFRNRAVVL